MRGALQHARPLDPLKDRDEKYDLPGRIWYGSPGALKARAIVQFGGRNVIEAIGKMLVDLDYQISEPIYADEHGWQLDVEAFGRRFWLQVTELGDMRILHTEDRAFRLSPNSSTHAEFLVQVDAALRKDGRFPEIRWFPKDYHRDAKPSESPVEP